MSLASGLVLGGRRRATTRLPATVVVPEAAAKARTRRSTRAAVVLRGIVWAGLLLAACAIGPSAVAIVMVPAALVAAFSALRAAHQPRTPLNLAVAVVGPALAAIFLVIADAQSANLGITLALLVCVYDAAAYVNGNGRGAGGRAAVVAGLLSVAVLAVLVAAVLVPPFTGFRPWIVLGLAGIFAPIGVHLAARVPGWLRLPALRRLDSMILAAPAWVVLVWLFVPH